MTPSEPVAALRIVSLWHRDSPPLLSSYARLGAVGVSVEPAARGYRADLFFWTSRARNGPCLGFFETEEEAHERAPELARQMLADLGSCACDFVKRCPRHSRERG